MLLAEIGGPYRETGVAIPRRNIFSVVSRTIAATSPTSFRISFWPIAVQRQVLEGGYRRKAQL